MSTPLSVLIVEDDESDADLVLRLLQKAHYDLTWRRVETADQMRAALAEHDWDIVISDYNLPQFDGFAALVLLQETRRDIPFIILSATMTEQTAVDLMKAGARDYIMKARKTRLVPAVARELISRDIRRNKQKSEEALVAANRELTLLYNNLPYAMFSLDIPGNKMLQASAGHQIVFGHPPATFFQKPGLWYELILPEDKGIVDAGYARLNAGQTIQHEFRILKPDGQIRWIQALIMPTLDDSGKLARIDGMASDITESKKTAETQARLVAIVESSNDAIMGVSLKGIITSWNRGAERVFGYKPEEIIGRSISTLVPEDRAGEGLEIVKRVMRGESVRNFETVRKHSSGKLVDTSLSVSPIINAQGEITALAGISRDITERDKLQEQLRQSQKLEAFGQLAGGVAHDFNNLLMVINGNLEILQAEMAAGNPVSGYISDIRDAGQKAQALTKQLLAFSRKQVLAPKVMDLNEIVGRTEKMLARLIGEDIKLESILDPALHSVKIDASQFDQVLINLAVNARDAMPRGGNLTFETRNLEWRPEDRETDPDLEPGNYVMLSVSDNGIGMNAELKTKVFEPFFTTKPLGTGTGLGLATVFGIIKQSGGHIRVYSEEGVGTSFKIYLPAVFENETAAAKSENSVKVSGGTETILLVEDEAAVRKIVKRTLESRGYHVIEAVNGKEAVTLSETYKGKIDLLITDVIMPEMGGRQLAEILRSRSADFRVLFMSGYTDDAVVRHGIIHETESFLQKPFSSSALIGKVRAILDGGA
jgi:two-component system, cell cycle sensor histidine kinase and response regulator CckA